MSRLFDHAQETVQLLVAHAREGHAEHVRRRAPNDMQIVTSVAYEAVFDLLHQLEESGHGFVLLRKKLAAKHYAQLARMVRPAGLSVSHYVDTDSSSGATKTRDRYYLHSGTCEELEARFAKILKSRTLVHGATL